MNKTLPLRRFALFATVLLLFVLPGHKAAAVEALLIQDTYVDPQDPDANFGNSGDLRVSSSELGERGGTSTRAFLKFSMDTLPQGTAATDIKQARLRLWVNSSTTPCGNCIQFFGAPPTVAYINLTPVTSAWGELDLTHGAAAALTFGLPQQTDLQIFAIGNFISIDVTDWVQAWIAGTLPNEGFMIEASGNGTDANVFFDSKESSLTSHEPQLDITLVGPAGAQGPAGPQGIQGLTGSNGSAGAVGPAGPIGATGPQGTAGAVGPQGPAGQPGATGPQGPQGQSADLAGTDYNWTTDTTDSWLENGDIRLNAPTGEGFIYLSDADVHGADQEIFVETMLQSSNPVKGYFVAVRPDNPRWMKMFAVTSGVEAGGYYRLGVLRIVEVGGTWPNNTPVKLTFIRNGDKGDAGAAGAQGAMGLAGPIGPKGDTGAAGATGDAGPIGPMGAQGPLGPMGLQGIEGPQGIAGTNGAKWYSWSGSPVQALGVLGDYYLDVVTGDVWQKVSNEGGPEWAVQGNIRGADGAVGAKGENGDAGPLGPQGPAGPAGLTGPLGPIGPQGPVGPGGDPGAAGPQGPPGPVLTRVDAQGDLSMGEFTQGPTP